MNHQPFTIIGPTEVVREVLFGAQQHDEHCKGWRWHLYVQPNAQRWEAVQAELRKMREERLARQAAFLQAAE